MLDAYLDRLGVTRPVRADLETLFAVHRAQVERISYENLDIYLGRPPGIDPAETLERIARGRGGYCFQLNGAFATLLTHLGYAVTWHVGGVHDESGPVGANGNHLALTVSGLPTADNPGGAWFVDAGLGDALYEPMPLREGMVRQGPFTYGLELSTVVDGGWHFVHAPGASFTGMDFGPVAAGPADFADMHRHLSTSPTSSFTKVLTVARRYADAVRILRGVHLVEHDVRGRSSRRLADKEEWVAALTALLDPAGVDLDTLWDKANTDYEAWIAGGGSSGGSAADQASATPDSTAEATATREAAVVPGAARPSSGGTRDAAGSGRDRPVPGGEQAAAGGIPHPAGPVARDRVSS